MDLRLSDGPATALPGYVRVEDAVNALGRQDHPDVWAQLPGWEQMPFRRSHKLRDGKGKRIWVRHALTLVGGRGTLHSIPLKLDVKRDERRACTRLYKSVRAPLQHALATKRFEAVAVHHGSGAKSPLDRPGIWTKQAYLVFFTGKVVLRDPPHSDVIADVLFEQTGFEKWLKEWGRANAKSVSQKLLEDIGRIIIDHEQQLGYDITRQEAFDLVNDVAMPHRKKVSWLPFKNYAWKPRLSKAGRKVTVRKIQDHHKAELRELIAKRLNRGTLLLK
ncbi:hypothetical protein ACIQW5_22715 [Methylorubrum thiocyanatum]|uniref:hypothetical protein n=1 Tax=Methylorubrum thiocyanatum TaxID=47958 RepID=UPI00383B1400